MVEIEAPGAAGAFVDEEGDAPVRTFGSSHAILGLWALALVVLLTGLGSPAVRRTQEARVLETAREMLERGTLSAWLIPHLNENLRLEKPPLAYWLSATSFTVFGVNDFAGRLPSALAGWLLLAVTYRAARRVFGAEAGLLASACLISSYLLVWNSRRAETDMLATLFVTAAIHFSWRFVDESGEGIGRRLMLAHACAVSTALAILAKGPPAIFVAIFLIAYCAFARRLKSLWHWVASGAPITLGAIALPWFLYIRTLPESGIMRTQLSIAVAGVEHSGPFWFYLPQMLVSMLPWSGFLVLGLIAGVMRCRRDLRLVAVLCWIGAIVVPLSLIGQKQPHYLLLAVPAFAVVIGWVLTVAGAELRPISRVILTLTGAAICICGVVIIGVAIKTRGTLVFGDIAIAIGALVAGIVVLRVQRTSGLSTGALALAGTTAACLVAINAWWVPSLQGPSARDVARELRARFGQRRYCSFGPGQSLSLVWELRQTMPHALDVNALLALTEQDRAIVAVTQEKTRTRARQLPPGFIESTPVIRVEDRFFRCYVLDVTSPASRANDG